MASTATGPADSGHMPSPSAGLTPARNDLRDLLTAFAHVVVLALVLLPGQVPWAGPVVLVLSDARGMGVHAADLVVVALGIGVLVAGLRRGMFRTPVRTPRLRLVLAG